MPHNSRNPGSPQNWLKFAKSDLSIAQNGTSLDVMLETLCFHAQQAAEKSIKAVLIHHEIELPKTHNIKVLIDLLPESISKPDYIKEAAVLTDYAVITRYPGEFEAVTYDEYSEALKIAEYIYKWAKEILL